MTNELNPAVLQKLDAFGRRRRTLILYRGVCTGLVSLIGAVLLLALVDWLFFLPVNQTTAPTKP